MPQRISGHEVTREHTGAGRAYVARARDLDTSPYLVMSHRLARLCAWLGPGSWGRFGDPSGFWVLTHRKA
jgi:hypothetical protein